MLKNTIRNEQWNMAVDYMMEDNYSLRDVQIEYDMTSRCVAELGDAIIERILDDNVIDLPILDCELERDLPSVVHDNQVLAWNLPTHGGKTMLLRIMSQDEYEQRNK